MQILKRVNKIGLAMLLVGLPWIQTAESQQPTRPGPPPQRAPQPSPAPISLDAISSAQFKVLTPNAMVIYNGKVMSKSDFMALRTREWRAAAPATNGPTASIAPPSDLDSIKSKFAQERTSELTAKNAALQTEFEKSQQDARRLMQLPQYAALAKEAADLRDRFNKATPDEKAKIRQRAAEVHSQLVQLEKTAGASVH